MSCTYRAGCRKHAAWIRWPSRAVRDAAWEKVMADPRMAPDRSPMPFDGKRMIYGGFQVMLET
jgi:uncharacterized protein YbaA (DUF1428 family)